MTKFLNISTDNTLGDNSPSDEIVSSQKAIKDYVDTADAKALRTKDTLGANCFVDRNAGNSSFPTESTNLSNSLIIGYTARYIGTINAVNGITAVGYNAQVFNTDSTALGASTRAVARSATAVGASAYAPSNYSLAVGYNANASGQYSTSVGASCATTQNYTVTIGAGASTNGQYSIAIGYNARVDNGASYGIALGRGAIVSTSASYACQLGQGTNSTNNTLQFRGWRIIENNGKLAEDRLPNGTKFTLEGLPSVSLSDDSKQIAALYVGETIKDENDNDVIVRDLCYRTKIDYSKPSVECYWVNTDYMQSTSQVYIDQQKFFEKLAEVSRERIDDGDVWNSVVGGDNSEQSFYLYYDGSNSEWRIEVSNSSIESMDDQTPDSIEGITDLREYGIYIIGDIILPNDDEEMIDINYYAPIYCDGYDCGDSSYVNIDYMKFMNIMCDSDYGFGYVTGSSDGWEYSDGTDTRYIPIVPKEYEWDGGTWDAVEVRFEWNGMSDWAQYINGEYCGYDWGTNQLASQFGIYVEAGEEESVEYIGFTWKPARQISWEQFDPIDASNYATASQITNLQAQITNVSNRAFQRIQTNVDLDNYTTTGAYVLDLPQTGNPSNFPTQAAGSKAGYLFVMARSSYVRQVLMTEQVHRVISTIDHGNYCSNVFIRTRFAGAWTSWQKLLSEEDFVFFTGFDETAQQKLIHSANDNAVIWTADSGGGGSVDIDNSTITKNGSDQLQAVATVNANTAAGATNPIYDWVGTLAEYTSQAVATNHPDWICYITDDQTAAAYEAYTKAEVDNIFATLYPVGSIYVGTQSTCPLTTIIPGSTWTLVSSGKALWTSDGTNANTTIAAGLPNITGSFAVRRGTSGNPAGSITDTSGAFTADTNVGGSYTKFAAEGQSYSGDTIARFSASGSNAIYGNSATVQPPAYVVNVWRRTA